MNAGNEISLLLTDVVDKAVKEALEDWFQKRDQRVSQEINRYLSRRQVAEFLNIGISTVDYWASIGRLNKIKCGESVRFDREELVQNMNRLKKYARC